MRLTADRIGVLVGHGLSEYQARVYLALLEFPALNAGALAKAAQTPRNRLYEVLEELQAVGLVDVILEDTRKYRALPLTSYLDRSVHELKERIGRIESQRDYLAAAFHAPELSNTIDLEAGTTRVLLSRRAVARELDRMVENVQRSLLAVGSTGGWMRLIAHLDKTPNDVLTRGSVELYLPRSAANSGGAERLGPFWNKALRYVDAPLRTITLVTDEREMIVVHPIPDDDKVRAGRDFALHTDNTALLRDHVDLIRCAAE